MHLEAFLGHGWDTLSLVSLYDGGGSIVALFVLKIMSDNMLFLERSEMFPTTSFPQIGGHLPENVKTADAIPDAIQPVKSAAKAVLVDIEFISLDSYMYTRINFNIK